MIQNTFVPNDLMQVTWNGSKVTDGGRECNIESGEL